MNFEEMMNQLGEWVEAVETLEDSLKLYENIEFLEDCLKLPAEE